MIGALDIGGTKIAAGLVDDTGRVAASERCPTDPHLGFDHAFVVMSGMLRRLGAAAGVSFRGVGVGCTGPVDPAAGVIGDAELLPGWSGASIVEGLAREFSVPCAMENDADAVALSEFRWGAGRGAECLIYVTVGTGIGCGIVRNGVLYRGAGGAHPEVGHMAVDLSAGPACYCGLTGCWESLASGPALESAYAGDVPAAEICRRARAGEARAQEAVSRLARYIATGLVNVVTAYCPDVVVLGGGVLRDADLFLGDVRRTVRRLASQVPAGSLRIEAIDSGKEAGLQGAAAAWLHRFESGKGNE